ncbi:MAG: peptidylprolyl isomerase [Planctomycetota bacterium]
MRLRPIPAAVLLPLAIAAAFACPAQEVPKAATPQTPAAPPAPHFLVRKFPEDRNVPVAIVGGQPVSLGDLIDHIDERHRPGLARLMETQPAYQRILQSDLIAPWVRQFADIRALELAYRDANIDQKKLEEAMSASLKQSFEGYLKNYVDDRQRRGVDIALTQEQVNSLLTEYQQNYGLAAELQGWLDYLETGDYTRQQLHDFFDVNARCFGGMVTIEHILIQHRDAGTGILLDDHDYGLAAGQLAKVKASLRPDGSNFEDVARLYSHDRRTAKDGGRIEGIKRFDDRLPAPLCRAAWSLRDGEVSDVVESQYGWHIIRRLDLQQNIFILFTDDAIPSIRIVMRRALQENRLFGARAAAKVELKL